MIDAIDHYVQSLSSGYGTQYMFGSRDEEIKSAMHSKYRYISCLEELNKIIKVKGRKIELLDIGTSPLTFVIRKIYPSLKITTIDYSSRYQRRCIKAGIHFMRVDLNKQDISKLKGKYDVILFLEVIEHLDTDYQMLIHRLSRLLKSNGICIIQTPNKFSPKAIIMDSLFKSLWSKFTNVRGLTSEFRHVREFSLWELERFITNIPDVRLVKSEHLLYFDRPETAIIYRPNGRLNFIFGINYSLVKRIRFLRRGMQLLFTKL